MNILISSNVRWWNAEAAYAATVAKLLQEAEHRVWVLTLPGTTNEEHLQRWKLPLITNIPLNTYNPFKLYKAYRQLKHFLREEQIEVVNAHRSEGFFIYVLLSWAVKSFRLIRTRGTTRHVRRSWINRKIYCQWTQAHILAGQIVADRLLEGIDVPKERLNVLYYPVKAIPKNDLQLSPELDSQYRESFNIPPGANLLCIVGRISPVKGHPLLFEAFKCFLESHPNSILLVLYKHPDPQRSELLALQELAQNLGIADHIRFIGPREDLSQIMRWIDLGVVSSIDSEVICRVAMEFFAAATPVIAFPTGCLPELVVPNQSGFLASEKTASALANSLNDAFSNKAQLQQLGQQAHQMTQNQLAPEHFLEATLKVFQS